MTETKKKKIPEVNLDIEQTAFGFIAPTKVSDPVKQVTPSKAFIPANLENGLDTSMVTDHAMLWLRGQTKKSRQNPKKFLQNQVREIRFKRSEHDPITEVRDAIVDA